MLEKWIDKHLEKHGFIKVPKGWNDDYKELINKNQGISKLLRELGREYNTLLGDYAKTMTKKAIKDELTEMKIDFTAEDDLVNLYVKTYGINFEDDTDIEVK